MSHYNAIKLNKISTEIYDEIIAELEDIDEDFTAPILSTPDRTSINRIITNQLEEIVEHYEYEIEELEDKMRENAPEDLTEEQMFNEYLEKLNNYRKGL